MRRSIVILSILMASAAPALAQESSGFLKIEKKIAKDKVETKVIPYVPREGDLVFYDDKHLGWMLLFAYAGTGAPLHMGIVVKKNDGGLAILEAGPDDTIRVRLLDLDKRLKQFSDDFKGVIQIRRCKEELTVEQSKELTKFAHEQDGKRYAIARLLLQGTPFRTRGPIREKFFGGTVLDRDSWICSELAVAAGTVVKLFDPKVVFANVAYPKDLVDNERYSLSGQFHDAAVWSYERPKD
jgi:hypothetical protein